MANLGEVANKLVQAATNLYDTVSARHPVRQNVRNALLQVATTFGQAANDFIQVANDPAQAANDPDQVVTDLNDAGNALVNAATTLNAPRLEQAATTLINAAAGLRQAPAQTRAAALTKVATALIQVATALHLSQASTQEKEALTTVTNAVTQVATALRGFWIDALAQAANNLAEAASDLDGTATAFLAVPPPYGADQGSLNNCLNALRGAASAMAQVDAQAFNEDVNHLVRRFQEDANRLDRRANALFNFGNAAAATALAKDATALAKDATVLAQAAQAAAQLAHLLQAKDALAQAAEKLKTDTEALDTAATVFLGKAAAVLQNVNNAAAPVAAAPGAAAPGAAALVAALDRTATNCSQEATTLAQDAKALARSVIALAQAHPPASTWGKPAIALDKAAIALAQVATSLPQGQLPAPTTASGQASTYLSFALYLTKAAATLKKDATALYKVVNTNIKKETCIRCAPGKIMTRLAKCVAMLINWIGSICCCCFWKKCRYCYRTELNANCPTRLARAPAQAETDNDRKTIRELIMHENTLRDHRRNHFAILQGFLWTAVSILVQSKNAELVYVIAGAGASLALVAAMSLGLSHMAVQKLKNHVEDPYWPSPVIGFSVWNEKLGFFDGLVASLHKAFILPTVLLFAWIVLCIVVKVMGFPSDSTEILIQNNPMEIAMIRNESDPMLIERI